MPFIRNVWALVQRQGPDVQDECTEDFFVLARHVVEKLSIKELETWSVIAWPIWNARNKVYKRIQAHTLTSFKGAITLLEDYQYQRLTEGVLMHIGPFGSSFSPIVSWCFLCCIMLILNCFFSSWIPSHCLDGTMLPPGTRLLYFFFCY